MPDLFRLRYPSGRPGAIPTGCLEWNGYVVPEHGRVFRRDELLELAAANGHRVTADLLHKWRVWRFVPGPTAGGATGKGRGKGQTWSFEAGVRVAWLSRWLAASLTYDALRLALWRRARELDDRLDDVMESAARFLEQDQEYHDRVLELPDLDDELVNAYLDVVYDGRVTQEGRRILLADAGVEPDDPGMAEARKFLPHLNFDGMQKAWAEVPDGVLRDYVASLRAIPDPRLAAAFWDSPLGLARIVVRELHRFRLRRESAI